MAVYKEIVTKAVLGKVKKQFQNVYTLTPEIEPATILGCWLINHKFNGEEVNNAVTIKGSFEINIWYSYDNDSKTAVATKKIDYQELVNVQLKTKADFDTEKEILVRALKQPTCKRLTIKDKDIEFEIEKELGVELVGDVKVKILIEEEEEPWVESVDEEVLTNVEKEITENVKADYLE